MCVLEESMAHEGFLCSLESYPLAQSPGRDAKFTANYKMRSEQKITRWERKAQSPSKKRAACFTHSLTSLTHSFTASFGIKGSQDAWHLKAKEHKSQVLSLPGMSSWECSPRCSSFFLHPLRLDSHPCTSAQVFFSRSPVTVAHGNWHTSYTELCQLFICPNLPQKQFFFK